MRVKTPPKSGCCRNINISFNDRSSRQAVIFKPSAHADKRLLSLTLAMHNVIFERYHDGHLLPLRAQHAAPYGNKYWYELKSDVCFIDVYS